MKTIQLNSRDNESRRLLKLANVKRIHNGWYTAQYNGIKLDGSTIASASYNKGGKFNPYEKGILYTA